MKYIKKTALDQIKEKKNIRSIEDTPEVERPHLILS